MYCGRELKKGEKCTCPQSVTRHGGGANDTSSNGRKKTDYNTQNTQRTQNRQTSYRTGYAGTGSQHERAKNRYRAKRAARRGMGRGGIRQYIVSSIITPVESVTNPVNPGMAVMLLIAAVMGALLCFDVYFALVGSGSRPYWYIMASMGLDDGYSLISGVGVAVLAGAIMGVVMFFLYTGIFYFINRFVMRLHTAYRDFCVRLVTAWIPFAFICLVGVLFCLLSTITLTALILCGAVISSALTYVALKTEWYSVPPSKALFSMLLGYFLFLSIMLRLILIIN